MFREHAERLSAKGLAFLIYDKRGVGRSTGDWREATFDDLCNGALGAVRELRTRKGIDREFALGALRGQLFFRGGHVLGRYAFGCRT
jgi:alpha-beta hydrolase superfamily lysophospholipase